MAWHCLGQPLCNTGAASSIPQARGLLALQTVTSRHWLRPRGLPGQAGHRGLDRAVLCAPGSIPWPRAQLSRGLFYR